MNEENKVCKNCGALLKSDENFCTECGTPIEKNSVQNNTNTDTSLTKHCNSCGAVIKEDQIFCPSCGHKIDEKVKKKSKGKIIVLIVLIFIAVSAFIASKLFVGAQAKDIVLNTKELELKAGTNSELTFTINPPEASNDVKWTSSNETIATVSNGRVNALNEGSCNITISTDNGKSDVCAVTVTKAGPDLAAIYKQYCNGTYATLASDNSYLSIDTNRYDLDGFFSSEASSAIKSVNDALELPDSVLQKMNSTRSIDGRQTYSNDVVNVSWTFHPDNGLEVMYELAD